MLFYEDQGDGTSTRFLKLQWMRTQLPPGPVPLPIIGNLWLLDFKLRRETLIKLTNIYGNIYTLWMGQTPLVVLNGYKAVKDGIVTHAEEVSGRPLTPFYRDMMGEKGIFLTSGHTWKQQRRFGMTIIRSLTLGKNKLEHQIQVEACHLVDTFASTKGKPFDPHTFIVHAIANIICAVVFGHRFSSDDESFSKLIKAVYFVIHFQATIWGRMYDAFPRLMRRLPGPHQKVFAYNEFMHNLVMNEVQTHERQNSGDPQDLIDFYLAQITKTKGDPTSTFNKDNMVQTAVDLLLGGTETTSTTLLWALLYMVQYPEIQENVQREIEAVLEPSHLISYEDRKKLPYTNAVIHEALRFSNVTSVGVPRQCVKNTTLLGFHIKKGTLVLPNLHSVVYDSEHWATPWKFNPNHFLDLDGNFVNKEAFLPFSAGHRVCLGEQMARVELFIFFTNLLRAFTFQLPEGVKEISLEYILGAILQPHPYKLCAIPC
ncbi:cytochrome P450 2J2-like isoform X2 [Athene cunicularia]|uniref:cytochrome P450 2J2-like isoform X2 n=1 Tax=Athene cunicularia TaxID=194338 RepID=UPI000EF70EFA|nr:cytochrome P450 2J2-like isoform X2 [Athene cunicularia]